MLISLKIAKAIEQDIKAQRSYLKVLKSQEQGFNVDLTTEKERVIEVVDFYEKILKDSR